MTTATADAALRDIVRARLLDAGKADDPLANSRRGRPS